MKRCSRCEREIPESATTCGHCDDHSVVAVPSKEEGVAPLHISAPQPALPPAVAPVAARGMNRPMLVAALLVVAGGCLAFAMLRTSAPPAVPAVVPAATPKPAAPKASKPAATPSATPTSAPAVAPIVTPKWNTANHEWLLNARKGVAFELPALKKVTIWQGISQPMLVVRCDAGRMQTFVYTASAIQMEAQDQNHSVRVSFDDEPEVTGRWPDSSDHDALFAPDAVAFARRLTTARTLRFGYTPHNAQRAVAEFHVTGLSDLIEPAAKQCGWKK
jgi:hypothetical protein